MQTIILPGYSPKNQAWAEETQSALDSTTPAIVINYAHWETGTADPDWLDKETRKLIDFVDSRQVNILAKSIGTAVAMGVLKQKPDLVNKVIFCGIPILDFKPGDETYYQPLKTFPSDKILCIQNADDNHGGYTQAEKFLHSLNPNLKIISKPRSDHEYPYIEDFIAFLESDPPKPSTD
ncbi:hypothetical protein A3H89_03210 [Candidatus Amesbacteria bacterium RIFCSPLOWO2_02_FULL_48_11]|uniref:Alpha/beta hydrolase n=5 Tax=Candidatus Amesiibacteriota TaxID=1752730 RepID=A0A1F4ZEU8_9BACT|nr:MAG: hypothetical protein UX78_C0004G0028 [Candidatus Amesbacteria bacterium GW2011_GWA2_47_11]KKU94581.1 MAG: hypothetical protein UY22_C0012G0015 [Candidatus Amesbacteria bacterium GW2011_GWC1_48_10]KKW00367.1 MAG: hypothetical protein UY33_C0012G0021 [Candidatus Amesbacteria bacterium GW2011_GWA1_48_9]OGC89670.1 MAG: hypothetical protein A2V48_03070 [Candidatus Amesbacteria bacterium RBG_19FT_COMBO_48_16]OGC96807.1 MAG: hypothetical protein A2W16_01865 [Candidatus Amesbacteria bacterium R